jgi:hypothetical protein
MQQGAQPPWRPAPIVRSPRRACPERSRRGTLPAIKVTAVNGLSRQLTCRYAATPPAWRWKPRGVTARLPSTTGRPRTDRDLVHRTYTYLYRFFNHIALRYRWGYGLRLLLGGRPYLFGLTTPEPLRQHTRGAYSCGTTSPGKRVPRRPLHSLLQSIDRGP